jgi:pimeloyl-ACP methyl ester carboxylesterase
MSRAAAGRHGSRIPIAWRRVVVVLCWCPVLFPICAAAQTQTQIQTLRWGPCPRAAHVSAPGAECATLSVPMDYAQPRGRRIAISVSRIPAGDPARLRGVLFGNPGGPGGDALNYWSARRAYLPARLFEEFDQIAVQPRGLRWSTPLDCARGDVPAPMLGASMMMGGRAACHAGGDGYPATITTETTARDMDEVRRALGVDRIDYLGGSYGTYLGAVYASLFPRHVDKMVLDSAVNPRWVWQEEFVQQQVTRQARLDDLFDWIAAHNAVYGLGATRADVYAEWARQVGDQGGGTFARFDPVLGGRQASKDAGLVGVVGDGLHLSDEQRGRVANLVRTVVRPVPGDSPTFAATGVAAYVRKSWPYLAEGMREYRADPHNTRYLDYLTKLAGGGEPTRRWVFTAVTCNENVVAPDRDALRTAASDFLTGAAVFDITAALMRSGMSCNGWRPTTTPVRIDGRGLATSPLILQSEHDTATAAPGGAAMAAALGGRLIRVGGGDHGLFGRGDPVLDHAVLRYLETGAVTLTHTAQAPITTPNPPTMVPPSN